MRWEDRHEWWSADRLLDSDIMTLIWRDWDKPREIWVKFSSAPAVTWAAYLQNTSLEVAVRGWKSRWTQADVSIGQFCNHPVPEATCWYSQCLTECVVEPCALAKHHAMKAYWGVEVYFHSFLDLGTRWRWVVSFTLRPLYSQRKSPWCPLDRNLSGPQIRSGRGGEEKNFQPSPGIEPWNPDRPARSQ